jgi:O-antigen/teichoic acid export membrane protein
MEHPNSASTLMAAVPEETRSRIVSGMRWTVWLSFFAVPFSYGTSILLARTGPEVIGTFGLLSVYIGFVTAFFYLGGDTVTIKFIPEIAPEERVSYLVSYFLVICLALIPWLVASAVWPDKLHYLFGRQGTSAFYLLILYLSPIYILLSLVSASLKGSLEIRAAQIVLRIITIGSFICYATLYVGWRSVLSTHYNGLIWGVFLGLALLATGFGLSHLFRLPTWRQTSLHIRFYLPRGFWRYTLSTQQVGMVGFLVNRLDYIMILNFGGLLTLGKYVAILTIASMITLLNAFFVDPLLPSLTNLIAARNIEAASQIFFVHMRILLFVNASTTLGFILLAEPLTMVLGPKYAHLGSLIALAALLVGLAAPGSVGGVLLSSVARQQRAVWIGLGQVAMYAVLFLLLWRRFNLLGTVLAYGLALLAANLLMLVVGQRSVPFSASIGREYAVFGAIAVATALLGRFPFSNGIIGGFGIWIVAMWLFLLLGRYRIAECRELLRYFLPHSMGMVLGRSSR